MYIGFFEYGDSIRYFGYQGPLAVTKFTDNLAEARTELASASGSMIEAARAPFAQAFRRRKLEIDPFGKASAVDYYPETLIVEFRPDGDEVHPFLMFFHKKGKFEGQVPDFDAAVRFAGNIHRFATLHHRFPVND
jgi:hypothetical protein